MCQGFFPNELKLLRLIDILTCQHNSRTFVPTSSCFFFFDTAEATCFVCLSNSNRSVFCVHSLQSSSLFFCLTYLCFHSIYHIYFYFVNDKEELCICKSQQMTLWAPIFMLMYSDLPNILYLSMFCRFYHFSGLVFAHCSSVW